MRISALISDVCSSDLIYQVVTRKLNRSAIIEIGKDGVARTAATVDPESRPASEMLTPDVVKRLASGEDVVVAAKPNQIEAVTLLYPNATIYLYATRDSGSTAFSNVEREIGRVSCRERVCKYV